MPKEKEAGFGRRSQDKHSGIDLRRYGKIAFCDRLKTVPKTRIDVDTS
jgi:hypothetical protein